MTHTPATITLRPYQKRCTEHIEEYKKCALWADMGLGKTLSTLYELARLYQALAVERILIVGPPRVVDATWPEEIDKWGFSETLGAPKHLKGTPAKRKEIALNDDSPIHLISQFQLARLVNDVTPRKWPYDTIVLDEASAYRSSKSKRFRALKRVVSKTEYMVQLTGTPRPAELENLWSQIYLLDGGERLGKTKTLFHRRYFNPIQNYWHGRARTTWEPKPGAEEQVRAVLSDICVSLDKKDWLDLPKRVNTFTYVDLPDDCRVLYDKIAKDKVLEFPEGVASAPAPSAVLNKQRQIANGAIYLDKEPETGATRAKGPGYVPLHSKKLEALSDVLSAIRDSSVLLAYHYRSDMEEILARFPQVQTLSSDASDTVRRWNAGEIPVLMAHPAQIGHGLNMQYGGRHVVWYGLDWDLELYEQFICRLERGDIEQSVIVHHILTRDTVETDSIIGVLQGRHSMQQALKRATALVL